MVYIGEKIVRLQDAKFKLQRNNSNEASIFITGNLAERLELIENTKAIFKIDKSDLIKLLCFTFTFNKTIFKKDVISLDILWFDKYIKLINNHFEKSSEFTFDVKKQSQDRFYLIGLEQSSGLNIRDLFIQDHIKIRFFKEDSLFLKFEFSNEAYIENISTSNEFEVIEDSILRQFALKSIKHIVKIYGESFLEKITIKTNESLTSDEVKYKIYRLPDYFKQGIFYSFTIEPSINNSRSSPRYINENLKLLQEEYIYLSTEWAYSGESNLRFDELVKFINDYTSNKLTAIKNEISGTFQLINKEPTLDLNVTLTSAFYEISKQSGLIFSHELIQRFVASLCTKPFVICSGLSGSGKTKLAQAFVQWISHDESQYLIIPVGADWTNREPLLGYPNSLTNNSYVTPENGVLQLILSAKENFESNDEPTKPYFLILDEMNLSHVERYFADFLSAMESGDKIPLHKIHGQVDKIPGTINLPKNLFIIGTVNIDETTYMFSPKVLDRANTIEFRLTDQDLHNFIESEIPLNMELLKVKGASLASNFMETALMQTSNNLLSVEKDLKLFFSELKKSGAEFGYRTASEIGRLIYMMEVFGEKRGDYLDIAIMQKLLPKLHGSRNRLTKVLPVLGSFCLKDKTKIKEDYLDRYLANLISEAEINKDDNVKYRISLEKICRMYKNAIENGFASYAEA